MWLPISGCGSVTFRTFSTLQAWLADSASWDLEPCCSCLCSYCLLSEARHIERKRGVDIHCRFITITIGLPISTPQTKRCLYHYRYLVGLEYMAWPDMCLDIFTAFPFLKNFDLKVSIGQDWDSRIMIQNFPQMQVNQISHDLSIGIERLDNMRMSSNVDIMATTSILELATWTMCLRGIWLSFGMIVGRKTSRTIKQWDPHVCSDACWWARGTSWSWRWRTIDFASRREHLWSNLLN